MDFFLNARPMIEREGRSPLALVTVVETAGSVPRHVGTRMLVDGEGLTHATIGGGRVEAEVTTLAAVPAPWRMTTIVLMPLAGRTALTVSLAVLPYARSTGGLAEVFRPTLRVGLITAVLLTGSAWLLQGPPGLITGGASLSVILLLAAYSKRKIGGFTGDTLGATCELTELIPALVACALGVYLA